MPRCWLGVSEVMVARRPWRRWKASHDALLARTLDGRNAGDPVARAHLQAASLVETADLFDHAAVRLEITSPV